jgi:acetolactate decarboxylase
MSLKKIIILIIILAPFTIKAQQSYPDVIVVGQMKDVMWNGQLYGKLQLDTIPQKKHLYGLGPAAYLKGELMIMDGKSYVSTVVNDTTMIVTSTYKAQAPFFAYTNVNKWIETILPDSIINIQQLERYLDATTLNQKRPYMFKLSGVVADAKIHVFNLPEGAVVKAPEDAKKNQTYFKLLNEQVDIVGFFSTNHQTIFTHHDTYLHMHLLKADHQKMGHLDEVKFKAGSIHLFLPQE